MERNMPHWERGKRNRRKLQKKSDELHVILLAVAFFLKLRLVALGPADT